MVKDSKQDNFAQFLQKKKGISADKKEEKFIFYKRNLKPHRFLLFLVKRKCNQKGICSLLQSPESEIILTEYL